MTVSINVSYSWVSGVSPTSSLPPHFLFRTTPLDRPILNILGPTASWCPMSPFFLTRWVSRLFELALVSWTFARVGVHRLSLRLPYLGIFSIHSSPAIGFHSCFFSTTDVFAPIWSTLHLLMVSFQTWNWLWYPVLWSQRRSRSAHEAEISFQISALAGVWANVTTRLRHTSIKFT